MLKLDIDSDARQIKATILLKDENVPIDIKLDRYKIIVENKKHYIAYDDIQVSKVWIDILITELFNGKIEISEKNSKFLKLIL